MCSKLDVELKNNNKQLLRMKKYSSTAESFWDTVYIKTYLQYQKQPNKVSFVLMHSVAKLLIKSTI